MYRLAPLILILLPLLSSAQTPMQALPSPCSTLDTMEVQPSGNYSMTADSLLYTPEGDTARVYAGTDAWGCTLASGETYVSSLSPFDSTAYRTTSLMERQIIRRISGDRTSPWWVGSFDHPLRFTAIIIHQRDGVEGLRRFRLPTDSLWTSE